MTRVVLWTLLSHWRRRPFQLLTLVVGLALATALWSGVQAVNAEARAAYARGASALGADALPALVGQGRIDEARYGALRRAGWPVAPMIEASWRTPEGRVRLVGLDPLTAPPGSFLGTGEAEGLADILLPPWRAFAHPDTAAEAAGTGLPEIVPNPEIAPGMVLMDIGAVQALTGAEGLLDRLLLIGPEPGPIPEGLTRIAPGDPALGALTDSFHTNLTAFGLLSFGVGLFIVNSAIGLAFEQRRGALRALRAAGVPRARLTLVMLAELMGLAAIAGLIGVVLGYLLAAALLPGVAGTLRGLYGAHVPGALAIRPVWWLAALGMALGGAGVAAAASLWRSWTLPVLDLARPEAWRAGQRRVLALQRIAAAALWGAGLLLAWQGSGLTAGFAMIGCLLIGAALLLPSALAAAFGLAGRAARGPVAQWLFADARQQIRPLSLALMALLLALSANLGVSTMVGSFRATFLDWLDRRLGAEMYVRVADADEAARLTAWLEARGAVPLPIVGADDTLAGPIEVFGHRDHATFRAWDFRSALDAPWDRVHAGAATLISEQLARRAGLSLGDSVVLRGRSFEVAGIYPDYGNPRGQAVLSLPVLLSLYDVTPTSFGVRLPPEDVPATAEAVRAAFSLGSEGVIDQAGLKATATEVFEQTFRVTAALSVLTLGVAGVALLTALLTLSAMRLPSLAPVWALGLTRRRLAGLELGRALAMAAVTALVALPVGLTLAWLLLSVVQVRSFGWEVPLLLFPGQWLAMLVTALATAALAAAWPAWRLARTPPARLIAVFAQER